MQAASTARPLPLGSAPTQAPVDFPEARNRENFSRTVLSDTASLEVPCLPELSQAPKVLSPIPLLWTLYLVKVKRTKTPPPRPSPVWLAAFRTQPSPPPCGQTKRQTSWARQTSLMSCPGPQASEEHGRRSKGSRGSRPATPAPVLLREGATCPQGGHLQKGWPRRRAPRTNRRAAALCSTSCVRSPRATPRAPPASDHPQAPNSEKVPAPHYGCIPTQTRAPRQKEGGGQFPRGPRNTHLTSSRGTSHPNSHTPSRIPIPAGAFLPPGLGRGTAGGRGKTGRKLPGALFGKSGRDCRGGRARQLGIPP